MTNIIFINFLILVVQLRQFDIKFRINDEIREIALKKRVLKKTFVRTSEE